MMCARRTPRRWRKDFPYYKVQLYNEVVKSWMDEARAFGTLEEAQAALRGKYEGKQSRLIVVERDSRKVFQE